MSPKILRSIDARRKAIGDQGLGWAVERDVLDRELAELALEWMMNPQSPRVPNLSRIRRLQIDGPGLLSASRSDGPRKNCGLSCRLVPKGQNPAAPNGWQQFRKPMLGIETAPLDALGRLCAIAKRDTGQSRRVGQFPARRAQRGRERRLGPDLWNVDTAVAEDMLTVLKLANDSRRYPSDLGFEPAIKAIWHLWRGGRTT
jgi:hypothetical protein